MWNFSYDHYILNTGSPHYVKIVPDARIRVCIRRTRNPQQQTNLTKEGINVNFVETTQR